MSLYRYGLDAQTVELCEAGGAAPTYPPPASQGKDHHASLVNSQHPVGQAGAIDTRWHCWWIPLDVAPWSMFEYTALTHGNSRWSYHSRRSEGMPCRA